MTTRGRAKLLWHMNLMTTTARNAHCFIQMHLVELLVCIWHLNLLCSELDTRGVGDSLSLTASIALFS
jgi:hypothetical protein